MPCGQLTRSNPRGGGSHPWSSLFDWLYCHPEGATAREICRERLTTLSPSRIKDVLNGMVRHGELTIGSFAHEHSMIQERDDGVDLVELQLVPRFILSFTKRVELA